MTKQEKIKKVIEKLVSEAYWYEGERNIVPDITKKMVNQLHSQGVVINVGQKLPISCGHAQMTAARYSQDVTCPLIEAGYVAFKPLIEEVTDGR